MKYWPKPLRSRPVQMPLLASALRAQVDEAEGLEIDALGDPAEHSGAVAVDAIPHDLAHEAADLLEAGNPVELGHAYRHLVPTDFWHQRAALWMNEPGFARGGPNASITLHPLDEQLEVPDRQIKVHVQLAHIIEILEAHRFQAGVECLDHPWPNLPAARDHCAVRHEGKAGE